MVGHVLGRFAPEERPELEAALERAAERHAPGLHQRMPSGAGHDAQMLARICPSAMIFVPSAGGLSHNVREHTEPADLQRGAQLLLQVVLAQANRPF